MFFNSYFIKMYHRMIIPEYTNLVFDRQMHWPEEYGKLSMDILTLCNGVDLTESDSCILIPNPNQG